MPGESNPTCVDDRCCYDETGAGIAACYHWAETIGYTYDADMDPMHHDDCWTGIAEDSEDQAGCRGCDIGCDSFKDAIADLFHTALWVDGKSYLRSVPDDRHGRDAQNRIFDLLTNYYCPTLIQRQCRVEHGSCYENNPLLNQFGGYVCWGHHVCQCTPGPTWTPVGECDNLLGGGYPVDGLTPDIFFFNFQGWRPENGVSPTSELFCRKWHPANGGSPRNAPITPYLFGTGGIYNAAFLRSREGLCPDVLVPCAGIIANTDCKHDNYPYDDCTYAGQDRDDLVGDWINRDSSSQGKFEDLWISDPDIRLRDFPSLSAQQFREHQLYADVFAAMFDQVFPHPDPPPSTIRIDRVDMPSSGSSNATIGFYERTWPGTQFAESELPRILAFPYGYTRWGGMPVIARMVITYCKINLYLTIPHFAQVPPYGSGEASTHWIEPYAVVEIRVHTGMICALAPTGITVSGEPVVVTNPTWGAGPDGGYDGIPIATPEGNEIIYARELDEHGKPLPVRVPRKWRWFGRLGSFSSPVTVRSDFDTADRKCENLIDVIGRFTVPALATANETNLEDPNRNYAGSISFNFSHQA